MTPTHETTHEIHCPDCRDMRVFGYLDNDPDPRWSAIEYHHHMTSARDRGAVVVDSDRDPIRHSVYPCDACGNRAHGTRYPVDVVVIP